jgi:hypothetical protein
VTFSRFHIEWTKGLGLPALALVQMTLKKLEEAPMAWAALKKKMFQKREKMGPQQQAEAAKIRQDSETFRVKVDNFRTLFKKKAPFGVRQPALSASSCDLECRSKYFCVEKTGINWLDETCIEIGILIGISKKLYVYMSRRASLNV